MFVHILVHDSTLLWDRIDALTTSHDMLSACARTFIEIDHDGMKNVIDMQYATPRHWHVLIPWSSDHVIFPPSHLVIPAFHIHIIIPMQSTCQFLEPIALRTSFIHVFSTVTPNQVIVVPKFSESHPLSLRANFMLMIVVFVLLYAWALGEFISKPMNEDYKIKYMRISRWNIRGLRSFLFKAMRQVSWIYITPIYFSVYSVGLELHVGRSILHTYAWVWLELP
jgi:hypothetical protein